MEADLVGLDLMVAAGYNPSGAIDVLQNVEQSVELPVVNARGIASSNDKQIAAAQQYWIELRSHRSLTSESRRFHPSTVERVLAIQEWIGTVYTKESRRPIRRLSFYEERESYLDVFDEAQGGSGIPDKAANDPNMAYMASLAALRAGKPELAIKILEAIREKEAGARRWRIAAAIAGKKLRNNDLARELTEKHVSSEEWKRLPNNPPDVYLVALYATPETQKLVIDINCRNEYRYHYSPLDYVIHSCGTIEGYKENADEVLNAVLETSSWYN